MLNTKRSDSGRPNTKRPDSGRPNARRNGSGNVLSALCFIAAVAVLFIFASVLDTESYAEPEYFYYWGYDRGYLDTNWWLKTSEVIDGELVESKGKVSFPEEFGEDSKLLSITLSAPSTEQLNTELQRLNGSVAGVNVYGSGEYILGSSGKDLSIGTLWIYNDSDIEIYGNVDTIYMERTEKLNLKIHGNVERLCVGSSYPAMAIDGDIEVDGNVHTLYAGFAGESTDNADKSYFVGNLTVKGQVKEFMPTWVNGVERKGINFDIYYDSTKPLVISNGSFNDGYELPHVADTKDDLIIYNIDGTKKKFSDYDTDHTALLFLTPRLSEEKNAVDIDITLEGCPSFRNVLTAKRDYGVNITPIVCIVGIEEYEFTDRDIELIVNAFPGAVIAYYPEYAKKHELIFQKYNAYQAFYNKWMNGQDTVIFKKNETDEVYYRRNENVHIYNGRYLMEKVFDVYGKSGSEISVDYHTQDEIRKFIKDHPCEFKMTVFEEEPSVTVPYKPGKIKQEVLDDVLNMLNQIRYIAGLSYNVKLDDLYTAQTQAGALINDIYGQMLHLPSKPEGMDDELYALGSAGNSNSNLSMYSRSLADSILKNWMIDSKTLGHRRWILNPPLGRTGFGHVGVMQVMHVFDVNGDWTGSVSAWPAQNMPLEYFSEKSMWSFSGGGNEKEDSVRVKLKRENTGEEWNFSSASSDGSFFIDNTNTGLIGCIGFRPDDISYKDGDRFEVSITGVVGGDVKYHVNFFSISDVNGENGGNSDDEAGETGSKTDNASADDFGSDVSDDYTGWYEKDGKSYWFEGGKRQGDSLDVKCFSYEGTVRGREIYDPGSDGWYWLDVNADGAKAVNKEVFMPYIYQDEEDHLYDDAWIDGVAALSRRNDPQKVDLSSQIRTAVKSHGGEGAGKWVRYDAQGKMIKGWYTVCGTDELLYPDQIGNTYYYDQQTGLMAKGRVTIDGTEYMFDEVTGVLIR